jgi:glutathione peroxidase
MIKILTFLIFLLLFAGSALLGAEESGVAVPAASVHDFTMKDIDGNDVALASYRGKVLMLVNVASKCGLTVQYEGLQKLYNEYGDRGFVVLGFPANNFADQEPGTNEEIKDFCATRFRVRFPMFSKISVKGEDIHPLFQWLTDERTNGPFAGEIGWNFNKFLVDRTGKVIHRFEPRVVPDSPEVIEAIEAALAQ